MDFELKVGLPVTGSADFRFRVEASTLKEAREQLAEYVCGGYLPRTVREVSAETEEPTYLGFDHATAEIDYDFEYLEGSWSADDLTVDHVTPDEEEK